MKTFVIHLLAICIAGVLIGELIDFLFIPENQNISVINNNDTTNIIVIDGTDLNLAIEYIKKYEGFSNDQYKCGGYYFVGYGHLITTADTVIYWTEDYATKILEKDLLHLVKYTFSLYDVTSSEAVALGMLFYNVSHVSIFSSALHSELLKPRSERNIEVIKNSWLSLSKYNNKSNDKLRNRREFELRLFLNK